MVPADTAESTRRFLSTIRTYVLEPISTAIEDVECERREIEREREAFEAFAERVNDISTVSQRTALSPGAPLLAAHTTGGSRELQEAYDETVLAVDHYERVYGESIGENLTAEYGPEFASLFDPATDVPFTDYHKEMLTSATRVRVEERESFEGVLEDELASLRQSRQGVRPILDDLDSTIVPGWYRDRFDERLNELIEERQADIGQRPANSRVDGLDLREYLYADEPWSYPVLTALGRLLDSVDVRS